MRTTTILMSCALLGTVSASGQQPAAPQLPMGAEMFRAPIHTATADPVGGDYGVWASGATYKVSFHDGVAFYPLLGPDAPVNMPVRWRTRSVQRGPEPLLADADRHDSATWHDDWRFEYRHGGVTEAYDVRVDGVEQTFVLQAPPPGRGDLMITGEIESDLAGDRRGDAHGPLLFRDAAGREIVRYGAAIAVDAAGDRAQMQTSFDGRLVRMTLSDEWLERASYPVVVDPLVQTSLLSNVLTLGGYSAEASIECDTERGSLGGHSVMVVYRRNFSGSDEDLYALLMRHDFTVKTPAFTDISANWNSRHADVALVGGPDRWAISLERDFPTIKRSGARVYVHDADDLALNSGTLLAVPINPGFTHTRPAIGGTANLVLRQGDHALLVFQSDAGLNPAQSSTSVVRAALVDCANLTIGPAFTLRPSLLGAFDQEQPRVSHSRDEDDSWLVVFQEFGNNVLLGHWGIVGVQIDDSGAVRSGLALGGGGTRGLQDCTEPQVDGDLGDYMVTFLRSDASSTIAGSQVVAQRVDWSQRGPAALGPERVVAASASARPLQNAALAFDSLSHGHWASVVRSRPAVAPNTAILSRLGRTGGIVEQHTISAGANNVLSPDVAYSNHGEKFLMVYPTDAASYPIYGAVLAHDAAGGATPYGVGCGGEIGLTGPSAWAGGEPLTCRMFYGAPNTPAALMVSLGTAAVNLSPLGMTGCFLNIDAGPGFLGSLPGATNGNGDVWQDIPLGDNPVFIGDFYLQWVYLDPMAPRPLKVSATEGLQVQVRV